jgi:hypothetical protein
MRTVALQIQGLNWPRGGVDVECKLPAHFHAAHRSNGHVGHKFRSVGEVHWWPETNTNNLNRLF